MDELTVVKREPPNITTCKATIGELRNQPLNEMLTTKKDYFHYLRFNMAQGYIPRTSHMFKI